MSINTITGADKDREVSDVKETTQTVLNTKGELLEKLEGRTYKVDNDICSITVFNDGKGVISNPNNELIDGEVGVLFKTINEQGNYEWHYSLDGHNLEKGAVLSLTQQKMNSLVHTDNNFSPKKIYLTNDTNASYVLIEGELKPIKLIDLAN